MRCVTRADTFARTYSHRKSIRTLWTNFRGILYDRNQWLSRMKQCKDYNNKRIYKDWIKITIPYIDTCQIVTRSPCIKFYGLPRKSEWRCTRFHYNLHVNTNPQKRVEVIEEIYDIYNGHNYLVHYVREQWTFPPTEIHFFFLSGDYLLYTSHLFWVIYQITVHDAQLKYGQFHTEKCRRLFLVSSSARSNSGATSFHSL